MIGARYLARRNLMEWIVFGVVVWVIFIVVGAVFGEPNFEKDSPK
jgi:hypothetical protein